MSSNLASSIRMASASVATRISCVVLPLLTCGRSPQDWSLHIEAVEGGLIDSGGQEAVTYAAPDAGYQPNETFTMSTSSNTWYEAVHQGFSFTSRNGQVYSKVGLSFGINQNPDEPIDITFGGMANTNGSRNWEGDPDTMEAAGQ